MSWNYVKTNYLIKFLKIKKLTNLCGKNSDIEFSNYALDGLGTFNLSQIHRIW